MSYTLLQIVDANAFIPDAVDKFFQDFYSVFRAGDRLSQNYLPENLGLENHLAYDALYSHTGEFVACSGIANAGRYPEGAYRLLNRTYYNPKFRDPKTFQFLASRFILPRQLERYRDRIRFSFVSRQGRAGKHFLARLARQPVFSGYQVSPRMIRLIPNGIDADCFQYIAYRNHSGEPIRFEGLAEEEWQEIYQGIYPRIYKDQKRALNVLPVTL